MVYRQAEPRARPRRVRALTLRRRGLTWRLLVAGLVVGLFVGAFAFARTGATLACARAAPGGEPRCVATDRFGTDTSSESFDARPGLVGWQEVAASDDDTALKVTMVGTLMQGSSTNEAAARALVRDYEAFVRDGTRLRFEATVGPHGGWAWPVAVGLALLFVGTFAKVDLTTRLELDLDADELVVRTGGWFRARPPLTLDWTEVREFRARSPRSDEENVQVLVALVGDAEHVLCVARDADAERAARSLTEWTRAERARRDEEARERGSAPV